MAKIGQHMTPRDKILALLGRSGISGKKASEVMQITYNTFKKNNNPNEERHNFNEAHYQRLVDFVKKLASEF